MIYDVKFKDEHEVVTNLAHALGRVEERKGNYAYVRIDEYPELLKVIGEFETPEDTPEEDQFSFNLEVNQMVFVAMIYVGNDTFQHSCYYERENDWIYSIVEIGKKTKDIEVALLNHDDVTAELAVREGKTPSFISATGAAAQEFVNKIAKTPTRKKIIMPEKDLIKPDTKIII
jgi:hypothetical protein